MIAIYTIYVCSSDRLIFADGVFEVLDLRTHFNSNADLGQICVGFP